MKLSRMKLFVSLVALAVLVGLAPAVQSECAYANEAKEISKINIKLSAPVDGTMVEADDLAKFKVKNGPKASTSTAGLKVGASGWMMPFKDMDWPVLFLGKIEAKKTYIAYVMLTIQDGYIPSEDLDKDNITVTVDGKKGKVIEFMPGAEMIMDESSNGAVVVMVEVTAAAKKAPKAKSIIIPKVVGGTNELKVKWAKIDGASKYVVALYECGVTKPLKKITVSGSKKSCTFKDLKTDLPYKVKVIAKNKKGKKIAKGKYMHGVVKNSETLANPGKPKINKKKPITLKVGGTAKMKAKVQKPKDGKTLISKKHGKRVRYISSNKNIATVSPKGVITAKAVGACKIYAVAFNGASTAIKVTVTAEKATMRTVTYYRSMEDFEENYPLVIQVVESGSTITLPRTFLWAGPEDVAGWQDVSTEKEYKPGEKVEVAKDMKLAMILAETPETPN